MDALANTYEEPQQPVGTVAELFAGVGGFRIGLSRANLKTVFSNQWEPATKVQHASDVYEARFGSEGHFNVDIATVNELPNVDIVVGGFPCQDYSVAKSANAAKGLIGKKGVLWWEILRLVSKSKPNFIFLENVDRLLKSPSQQRGRDFAVMLRTLGSEGYTVEWRVVNAAAYGFAQRRIRVFIVAYRTGLVAPSSPVESIIFDDGILARALPIVRESAPLKSVDLSADADVISATFNLAGKLSPFENSGVFIDGIAYTTKTIPQETRDGSTLGSVLQSASEIDESFYIAESRISEWEYLKGAKSIPRQHASGAMYNYTEGSMAFPDSLEKPSRTVLTGEGGSSPSRFKHIIKVGRRYRRLTPVELERLNGFPDNWTATGRDGKEMPDVRRAFFMGNALVVGLIERVGHVLASEIEKANAVKPKKASALN